MTNTGGQMKGLPHFPGFHANSQVLKIHRCEKYFKMSYSKESHKLEVLARIYFSKTG
jgi:hypothetical protein